MSYPKIKIVVEKGDYMMSESETRKTVDLLEQSDLFWKGIKILREKYRVPGDGYPFDQIKYSMEEHFNINTSEYELLDQFFEEAKVLSDQLRLPEFWWSSIAYFAFYNVFFVPERTAIEINRRGTKEGWLEIRIKENMSKRALLVAIEDLWGHGGLSNAVQTLPKAPVHRMRRIEIAKEITRLRDNPNPNGKKRTFREISDLLEDKYQDNDEIRQVVVGEDNVKMLYRRWKDLIIRFANRQK